MYPRPAPLFASASAAQGDRKRVRVSTDPSLSSRFATGASVTQSVQHPGIDEIHIQGDVVDDVKKMLVQRAKPFELIPPESEGGLTEKNIVIDDKAAK